MGTVSKAQPKEVYDIWEDKNGNLSATHVDSKHHKLLLRHVVQVIDESSEESAINQYRLYSEYSGGVCTNCGLRVSGANYNASCKYCVSEIAISWHSPDDYPSGKKKCLLLIEDTGDRCVIAAQYQPDEGWFEEVQDDVGNFYQKIELGTRRLLGWAEEPKV